MIEENIEIEEDQVEVKTSNKKALVITLIIGIILINAGIYGYNHGGNDLIQKVRDYELPSLLPDGNNDLAENVSSSPIMDMGSVETIIYLLIVVIVIGAILLIIIFILSKFSNFVDL